MRLASFDGGRVGVVRDDVIVDVSDLVEADGDDWPPLGMVRLIARRGGDLDDLAATAAERPGRPLADVRLETPVPWPSKVIGYPANYHDHIVEMSSRNRANVNGFFLKAPSSLSGPADPIVLPEISGAEIHHECEVGLIVGRGGRHVAFADALDHVFGYSCLMDMTVRGSQERVMRKSFDTFTPVGPWIVTADEIADPDALDMSLWVNGVLRQHANTRDLIVGMREMVVMASSVMTLHPGDVIATGTCAGVGPLAAGDVVRIEVESVGVMEVGVVQGSGGSNIAFESGGPTS